MKLCIVGIGNLGAAIANALLLRNEGLALTLYEPHSPSHARAKAEFYDLLPVARVTNNKLLFVDRLPANMPLIITAGIPRKSVNESKASLFGKNMGIVLSIVKDRPKQKLFIATNPPIEISARLNELGYNAVECRKCTDHIRKRMNCIDDLNAFVLEHKGYTAFTPGIAIAERVMEELK